MVPLAVSTYPLGTKISKAAELKLAGMGSKNPASDSESEKINPHPLIPGPVLSDYRRNGTMVGKSENVLLLVERAPSFVGVVSLMAL